MISLENNTLQAVGLTRMVTNPNLIDTLLKDIRLEIFSFLTIKDLETCSVVSRAWKSLANDSTLWRQVIRREIAFGKAMWAKYFGDSGIEPPLPRTIPEILNSRCPFWPDKKVRQTHLLVLIPETVNGKPLTLKTLGELVQKPLQGHSSKYGYFTIGEYTDLPAPKSHWALMTRDVIQG